MLFGDAGCGRAELVERYLTNLFESDTSMTIGVDFSTKTLKIDEKKIILQIFDFGDEERFRFLLPTYVKGANGGIFLYDVTNYSTIAHIDDWLTLIRKEINYAFPIIVVGNNATSKDRVVSNEEGIQIAESRGMDAFIECDTKTGKNVEEMFETLARLMIQKSDFY